MIPSSRANILVLVQLCAIGLIGATAPAHVAGVAIQEVASSRPADTETSALLNQQLDATIDLAVVNQPLPEVLSAISAESGVAVVVSDETWALLPYGRETPINVTVRNAPLRKTLEEITSRLGLEYVLRSQMVELRPLPSLQRTGRRATVQELAGLDLLRQIRLELTEDRPTADAMLEAIDLKLQELDDRAEQRGEPKPGFQIENRLDEELRQRPVFVARNATLLSALEALAEQTQATWFPWADSFIVLRKQEWVRRRLEVPVNLNFNQIDIAEAIAELQRAANVPFSIEPGALLKVPPQGRRVRLLLTNRSVRDALESLAGVTGLGYEITETGVRIYFASGTGAEVPQAAPPEAEKPILVIDVGDGVSLLVYPSQLPPAFRGTLEARRAQAIEELIRKSSAAEPAN